MKAPDRPRSFWRVLLGSWAILAVLSGLWALATPIGAAPDEPAHLIKAASVARGQLVGAPGQFGEVVQVPLYIAYTHTLTCYAFVPDEAADCMPSIPENPAAIVDASTTAGLYNPLYYALVGWPSLVFDDEKGIYAMRAVGAILTSLLLALSFALISRWRAPTLPSIGLAVAITPMVLFLAGTVNPNSIEVAATLTAFAGMLTLVRDQPGRLWPTATIVFVSAAVAANMRGLSLLWLAIALAAPLVLLTRARFLELIRTRAVQVLIGVTLLAAVVAAIWLLSTNSLGSAIDDPDNPSTAPGIGTSPLFGFVWTLFSTFEYDQGIVGVFGWLDTPAPTFVFFVWAVLAGGLLLLAIVLLRGRALALVLGLGVALLLLPPVLQGIYITSGGIIWQGRYILPIFVITIVAAGALLADRLGQLERGTTTRLLVVVAGLWSFAQFQSFATALRRYAVGHDGGWLDLLTPEWSPPGGVLPVLAAFGVAAVAAAVGFILLVRRRSVDGSAISERDARALR